MWSYLKDKKEIIGLVIALLTAGWFAKGKWDYINGIETRVFDTVKVMVEVPVMIFREEWESSENVEDSRLRSYETELIITNQRLNLLEETTAAKDLNYAMRLELQEEMRNVFLERDSNRTTLKRKVYAVSAATASALVEVGTKPDSLVPVNVEYNEPRRRGLPILRSIKKKDGKD